MADRGGLPWARIGLIGLVIVVAGAGEAEAQAERLHAYDVIDSAGAYLAAGDTTTGLALVEHWLAADASLSTDRARVLMWLAQHHHTVGAINAAAAAYLELVRLTEGRDSEPFARLGALELERGRPDSAISHYRRAILAGDRSSMTQRELGLAHARLGHADSARAYYDRAGRTAFDPVDKAQALNFLGMLERELGRIPAAHAAFLEAVRRLQPEVERSARDAQFRARLAPAHALLEFTFATIINNYARREEERDHYPDQ